jgi:hypothetical protein
MSKPLIAAIAALSVASFAHPADAMSEMARKIAVQRACQVAIWAMPAVSTWDIANGTIRDLGGKVGDIVFLSQPMTSRHGFLTANDVTPYAVASLTTKDGPLVVEVPPASEKTIFFGTFVDAWMRPVADAGPNGSDEGKGAKYLFLPPGHDGETPDGYLVFPLESYSINFALRPVSVNGGTIPEAVAYARTLRTYLLIEADTPPPTTFIDAFPKKWNTLPSYDLTYFQDINNVIQNEPVRERDKAMLGVLAELGIEKDKPFEPSEEMVGVFEDAARCAFDYLQESFVTPGGGLVPFYGGNSQWQAFNVPIDQAKIGFPFEKDGVPLIDLRAKSYFYLTYYPAKLGASSFYITALRDAEGELMNGEDTYRLNVSKDTPARDFWSAIVYSLKSKGFIEDAERVGLSSRGIDHMIKNDDGSIDLYFAPAAPEGFEANWLPTGEDFFVMFRLYGPEEAAIDKSWVLDNIEKVN